MEFDFNLIAPPPTGSLQLFLCPWTGISLFGGFQHPLVDGCSAARRDFGVLAGEDERRGERPVPLLLAVFVTVTDRVEGVEELLGPQL